MEEAQAPASGHAALADALMKEIEAAKYPVGGRFPTEQELQDRFGVGRHTIREALKVLTEQGLLGRRRKTGTIVLSHRPISPYVHSLRDVRGLFDFARTTRLEILHEGFVATLPHSPGEFAQLADKRWLRLAGLRYTRSDDEPLCWSEIFVPERFAPDRVAARKGDRALYEIVMDQNGLKLDYVEQDISAVDLPEGLVALLKADGQGAALLVKRRYVAPSGVTFEISHNLYPANRFSMRSIIRQRA